MKGKQKKKKLKVRASWDRKKFLEITDKLYEHIYVMSRCICAREKGANKKFLGNSRTGMNIL